MKTKRYLILLVAVTLLYAARSPLLAATRAGRGETEVRGVIKRIFEELKSGQYEALYETLPAASRARISRERFTNALQRTRNMYEIDRLEIGAVRVSGDIAVADTVMYGRVLRPIESEGKIVAQQYLVYEDGRWRVATGDRATVRRFLAANPRFARKFPIREPRVYVKRDGQWVAIDLNALRAAGRQAVKAQ